MQQPAFTLEGLDPLALFGAASLDGDDAFDDVLAELDLSLAPDTTSTVVHGATGPAAAEGLRQLFGLAPMQQQQPAMQQQQQQQQQGAYTQAPASAPFAASAPLDASMPQAMAAYPSDLQAMLMMQQQQLAGMAQQQQQYANQQQQQQQPMFTFSSLPQQQQEAAQHAQAAAAAGMYPVWSYLPYGGAAGLDPSGGMLPPGWQLPAASAHPPAAAAGGAAAANSRRKGAAQRNGGTAAAAAPAAAAVPPADKPKAPSTRFRERQKATIASLEAEVTARLAQLQALSEENETLKLRTSVLEAVTSGREYHMRIIQEHGPPTFDTSDVSPQNSGSLACGGSLHSATTAAAATDSGLESSPDAGGGGGAPAGAASGDDAAAADDGAPTSCRESLRGAAPSATPEQERSRIRCIKSMSASDIQMHWREFLADVSQELLTADDAAEQLRLANGEFGMQGFACSRSSSSIEAAKAASAAAAAAGRQDSGDSAAFTMSSVCRWCGCTRAVDDAGALDCCAEQQAEQQQRAAAAGSASSGSGGSASGATGGTGGTGGSDSSSSEEKITQLVCRYSYLTKFVALLNPGVLYSLFGRNLDTGEPLPYTDAHWRSVVSRLQLSKPQVTHVLACAELYFSSLSTLLQERTKLQTAMGAAADGSLSECDRRLFGLDGISDQLQLLEKLSANLRKEHVLRIMLNCFVWGRILTAVQFAKTAVHSHPYFPDVHAMVCVIYEEARAAEAGGQGASQPVFPHRIAAARAALSQQPGACA